MYNGLEIIDFHVHFPTRSGTLIEGGPNPRQQYAERLGERRVGIAREQAMSYNRQWRATWGFDPPERNTFSDEEQADRWASEIENYGLRAVGFVTGGGNRNLANIVRRHPDKFIGFAHHYLFSDGADDELRRAVREDGLKATNCWRQRWIDRWKTKRDIRCGKLAPSWIFQC